MDNEVVLANTTKALADAGIHNASQEAGWLLSYVAGKQPVAPPSLHEVVFSSQQEETLAALVQRRVAGEPLQYVLGSTEFYGLEMAVGPGALIPRPETERLVEIALELHDGTGPVIDMCTGPGTIALALAHHLPKGIPVLGIDISDNALEYARRNASSLGLSEQVEFREGDLFSAIRPNEHFFMITANPPYVSTQAYRALPEEVRQWEPKLALWASDGGLDVFRRIARDGRSFLLRGGWFISEISPEQSVEVDIILRGLNYQAVEIRQDHTQRDRVVVARWGA